MKYRRGSIADLTGEVRNGRYVLIHLPKHPTHDPAIHFVHSVNNLFDHVMEDVGDSEMVEITLHNKVNQSDKPIGFNFRRKDQLSSDVIQSVSDKLSQFNTGFNASDTLILRVNSVTMHEGFGKDGIKKKQTASDHGSSKG